MKLLRQLNQVASSPLNSSKNRGSTSATNRKNLSKTRNMMTQSMANKYKIDALASKVLGGPQGQSQDNFSKFNKPGTANQARRNYKTLMPFE